MVPMVMVELGPEWQVSQRPGGGLVLLGSLRDANLMHEQLSGVFYSGKDFDRDAARIKRVVATKFCLTMTAMLGYGRRRNLVMPRQISMWLIRELGAKRGRKISLNEVAAHFKREDGTTPDHGTVLHAVRCVDAALQNPEHFRQMEEIKLAIKEDEKWTQTNES